jgi:hypothetical protein
MRWFWAWSVAGFLLAVGVLAITSFGIFVLTAGLVFALIIAFRRPRWPSVLGMIVGVGAALLWPVLILWGVPRCGPVTPTLQPGQSYTCTALNIQRWSIAGVTVIVTGLIAYGVADRKASGACPVRR